MASRTQTDRQTYRHTYTRVLQCSHARSGSPQWCNQNTNVAVPNRNRQVIFWAHRQILRLSSAEGGAQMHIIDVADVHDLHIVYEPHPQRKITTIACQTWWCARNMQWNNYIWFLFGTAAYVDGSSKSKPCCMTQVPLKLKFTAMERLSCY